jgi:hypothetical protein
MMYILVPFAVIGMFAVGSFLMQLIALIAFMREVNK